VLAMGIFGNGQGPQTAVLRVLGYPRRGAELGLFICLLFTAEAGGYQCRINSVLQRPKLTVGNFWYFSCGITTVSRTGFWLGFFFVVVVAVNFIDFLC